MKILFYDAKSYDIESFDNIISQYKDIELDYSENDLRPNTARYAVDCDAVCAFVNSDLSEEVLGKLSLFGVKLILLRCAGFNNVDLSAAKKYKMTVLRVPGYSPHSVAEHAMALALASNRRIHKGYIKVRENNFSLAGLEGMDFYGKTAGIIGTGKIGAAMCNICRGFGMKVLAFDMYQNPDLDYVEYVDLNTLLKNSDLISLHCPLTDSTRHLINKETIEIMKDNVVLVNTSRGGLIKTEDLIQGNRKHKFHSIGLDVYEEESENVFENREDDILQSSITSRLLSFPNVIVTSHQGFFTHEALDAISSTTLDNAMDFINGTIKEANEVK